MQNGSVNQSHAEDSKAGRAGRHNGITMLLCVFAAICIWFYVMSIDSPASTEHYDSVVVQIINNREDTGETTLSPISGVGSVIEVKLKGRKTVLSELSEKDIAAYVDVSNVAIAGRGVYNVTVEAPAGTVIEDYSPKEISVYMDKKATVGVPVRCRLLDYTLGDAYSLSDATMSIANVQISGPQSELASVEYAEMTLSPGMVTASFSGTNTLQLYDKNGNAVSSKYITMSQKEATASYSVYTTRFVNLGVAYQHGYFEENGTEVTLTPTRIRVRGTVEKLNALPQTLTAFTLDETLFADDGRYVSELVLPEGIEPADTSVDTQVTANIRFNNTWLLRMVVPARSIELVNVPEGKSVEFTEPSLSVQVRCTNKSLPTAVPADISVRVDLQNAINSGEQWVPATATVRGGNSADYYTVGTYSVQIRVTDEADTQDENEAKR